jgi:phage repressor protein C with HTH and peptisase S24 domain
MAAQFQPAHDGQAGAPPWERIRAARQAKGWSQEFLARQVGVSQPAIVNIERGWTARSKFLSRIAKVLEIDLTDLDDGLAEITYAPTARVVNSVVNFPVLSSTESGAADLTVDTQPTEHMARPAPLAHVKDAYGVFVTGASMEPEFRPGDIALINPHLPVIANQPYIFYAEKPGAGRATIKWLRRDTDDRWHVTQHNPSKDLTLSRKEWPWAHRLIGKYARR